MGFVNVEIKARCLDHATIRQLLTERQAGFKGTDHQIDTYFNVPTGRLKLREGNIENNLIYYNRPDQEGPKLSAIDCIPVPTEDGLKQLLTNALGVKVSVDKTREIYFIGNMKFHLDTVQGLGTFMEIEAIDYEGTIGEPVLRRQCQEYMELFKIQENDLLAVSYSDLLAGQG